MDLGFSLKDMDALYNESTNYKDQFARAIENLDRAINETGVYWTSDETGTYENFKKLYGEKRQILVSALEYMTKFCNKVSEKRTDFTTAARNVNNTIQ